jgi:hypothetical protein
MSRGRLSYTTPWDTIQQLLYDMLVTMQGRDMLMQIDPPYCDNIRATIIGADRRTKPWSVEIEFRTRRDAMLFKLAMSD